MNRLMVAILASGMSVTAAAAADVDNAFDLPLKPTISTAIGYDTNPEDVATPNGSLFHEQKAGLTFESEGDGMKVEASAQGEMRRYEENSDANSWSYELDASADYKATDDISVGLSASHAQENDQGDKSNTQKLSASVTHETDLVKARLATILDRNDDADNQFDYQNFGFEEEFTFFPKNEYAPFLRTAFTNIQHPDQASAVVDRNARESRLTGGLRYKITDFIESTIGASYTYRNFKAAGTPSRSGFGFEAETSWTPWDFLEVSSGARRYFEATDVDTSLVADVREVDASVKIKATDYVSYKSSLTMQATKEVGANEKSLSVEFNNRATLNAFQHLAFFAEFNKEWEKTVDLTAGTSEKTSGTTALVGVEASF
jgi:hypothetical protein